MLLYIKRAPPKVPKTRSRAGCEHCRIKKKKCDEARPDCTRCKDLGQECIYGQPRPRVRRGSTLLPPVDLGMDHPLSVLPVRQMSPSPHCTPAPLPSLPAAPVEGPSSSIDDGHELSAAAGGGGELLFPIHADDEVLFADILDDESFQIPLPLPPQEEEEEEDLVQAATSPSRTTTMSSSSSSSSSSSRVLAKRASLPPSPRRNSMAFYATPHLELNMPLFSEYTNIKGRRALLDHFANVISHLIVLREDQGDNPFQQLVLPMSRQSPAVASAIYALSSAHLEFRGVGGGGGSWEQRKSILFHTEAARNLANLIEKGAQGNQNELLAAVMLLIYYEVLVHRERSHIVTVHLKGAMAILNSAPGISDPTRAFLERAFRFYDVIAALSFRSATLSDAPVSGCVGPFLPVDSRGASRPLGSADALLGMATSLWPIVHRLSNLGALKDELIAAEKAGDDNAPLLRAELKTAAVAIEASLTAWEPEFPLDQDNGTGTGGGYEMTGAFRGILHNALAYRHSALVHLYRSIYGAKRQHPMVQEHTRASLKFCLGTVDSAGPMGALLWPLFVAACEAQAGPDRETATMAFRGIERHQGMANIAHSWMIVEEVWRRADEADTLDQFLVADSDEEGDGDGGSGGSIVLGNRSRTDRLKDMEFNLEEEDLWRQVCRDMGLSVVFG